MAEPAAPFPDAGEDPGRGAARPFHGWWIVLVGAVVQGLGAGLIGVYGFVASPIVAEFGASETQIGLGMSIFILVMAVMSPVVGVAVDRGPIRLIMALGVGIMLGAVFALSRGTALWHLGLAFGLCSAGIALYGPIPASVLLVNWFVQRRGRALALAGLGYSAGSFVVPPLSAFLVARLGWRGAVTVMAAGAAAIVLPVVLRLVVRRPEELGQHPDGLPLAPEPDLRASVAELSTREIVANRNFWLLGLGMGIAHCVPAAGLFLVRHMESYGIDAERAALAFVVMGVFGVGGKLGSGALADRFDERWVAVGVLALYGGSWVAMASAGSFAAMLVAAVPMGLGGGGLVPMGPLLVGACFGRAVVGRISGLQAALGLPFLLSSAPVVGLVRDQTGSYTVAFLGLAGLVALAAVIVSGVALPRRGGGAP